MANLPIGDTIEFMTGSPYGVTPGGPWQTPLGPPAEGYATARRSRLPLIVGIGVGIIGIAAAVISWTRPITTETQTPEPLSNPPHTVQDVDTAKRAVCDAHALIDRATDSAASRTSDDPSIRGLLSLNVRIGAVISSNFIVETAAKYPATPLELTNAVRDLALAFNRTTLLQISEAPEAELKSAYDALDAADARVSKACE